MVTRIHISALKSLPGQMQHLQHFFADVLQSRNFLFLFDSISKLNPTQGQNIGIIKDKLCKMRLSQGLSLGENEEVPVLPMDSGNVKSKLCEQENTKSDKTSSNINRPIARQDSGHMISRHEKSLVRGHFLEKC